MDISSLLTSSVTDQIVSAISTKLNIPESKSRKAVDIASSLLASGLAKNSADSNEAVSISQALAEDHDGNILKAVPDNVQNPAVENDGFKIIGHILGNNKATAANIIGKKLNISSSQVQEILALVAPFVMGAIGKEQNQNNYNAIDLSSFLSSLIKTDSASTSNYNDLIAQILNRNDSMSLLNKVAGLIRKIFNKIFRG